MKFYELYLRLDEENRRTMEAEILIDLPDVRQSHRYDCGPACIRALAKYFLDTPEEEDDFIERCGATSKSGSPPHKMVEAAKSVGLDAVFYPRFSEKRLRDALDQGRPVVIPIQAWGNPNQYDKLQDGHWVVVIGYDEDNIYCEDPSLKSVRGFLTYEELEDRWKDQEAGGERRVRSAIVVWKDGAPRRRRVVSKARHID